MTSQSKWRGEEGVTTVKGLSNKERDDGARGSRIAVRHLWTIPYLETEVTSQTNF